MLPAAAMVVATTVGALSPRIAARWTMGAGPLLLAAGSFAQASLDAGFGWTSLVLGLVLVGVGTGLLSPTTSGAALAAVPAGRSGMAGGVGEPPPAARVRADGRRLRHRADLMHG
ncbi:hypothetical protein [Streptomyces sp. NPDC057253]|uniref:hypothetical protein n=1 Tax=Streptomyces sp. NPDC057253 TaxID=3346069 RepID=UPI00363CABC6